MRMEYFPMGLNFDNSLKVRYVLTRGIEKYNCAAGAVVILFRGFPRKALGGVVQSWVKITQFV